MDRAARCRCRMPAFSFADRRWRALTILGLYGYQGLVAGFALTAVPNWQAGLGTAPEAIGAYVALVGLPWTLQPLWGPVVDRFGGVGHRRRWILLGLGGAVATLLLLPLAGEGAGALALLGPLMLLHGLGATLADTATDGLIIDGVPDAALGRATALTRAGFALGTATGAAVFAWGIPALGLGGAMPLLLALAAALVLVPVLVREAPLTEPAVPEGFAPLLRSLREVVTRWRPLALLLLCVATEFCNGAFGVRLAVALVQEGGWDASAISHLQGALALLGGTLGALAVGWWSDRSGARPALVSLLALCALSFLGAGALLQAAPLTSVAAAAALCISGLAPALFFVSLAPAVMLGSRGEAAASRFALFMAALNLGGVCGAAASAPLGAALGLPLLGVGAACVFAGCAALATRPGVLPASDGMVSG